MADISDKSLQEALEWFDHELRRRLKEAEAMCEWLAEEGTSSDFRYTWTTADERIDAALVAYRKGGRP